MYNSKIKLLTLILRIKI